MSTEAVKSVAEAKKVPIEAVREPVGKTVIKKFWNISKRFGFVPKFLRLNGKVPLLFSKILEHIKTFWFYFKVFRLSGKVPLLF